MRMDRRIGLWGGGSEKVSWYKYNVEHQLVTSGIGTYSGRHSVSANSILATSSNYYITYSFNSSTGKIELSRMEKRNHWDTVGTYGESDYNASAYGMVSLIYKVTSVSPSNESDFLNTLSNGSYYWTVTGDYIGSKRKIKDLIGIVSAPPGTYPDNGFQKGYWYRRTDMQRVIFSKSGTERTAYCSYNGTKYWESSDFYVVDGDEITVGVPKDEGNPNVYGVINVNGVAVVSETLAPVSYTMIVSSDVYISLSTSTSRGPGQKKYIRTINIQTADVNPWYTVDVSGGSSMGLYVSYNSTTYTDGTMMVSCNDTLTIKRGYYVYGTCSVVLNGETVATIGSNSSYSWTVTSNASIVISGNTVTITTK